MVQHMPCRLHPSEPDEILQVKVISNDIVPPIPTVNLGDRSSSHGIRLGILNGAVGRME